MSDDVYGIHAEVTADDTGFQSVFDRVTSGLGEWGINFDTLYSKGSNFFKGFGIDIDQFAGKLGVSGPLLVGMAGIGIAAVKIYGEIDKLSQKFEEFDESVRSVYTLLPELSEKAKNEIVQDVNDFAKEFGTLPNEVIPALYQALSAGVPQDNVFDFLETAQKAAVGGVTNLEVAVDGLTSVVNAYGTDVLSVEKASDIMFMTVKDGKTEFDQLSKSLYNVIPTAAAAGVEFGNVGAALAAITAQGTPTSVATTQLRQLLVELSSAGTEASEIFTELAGKTFKQFVAEGGNLADALKLMDDKAKSSNLGINDLFSSVEAGNAALQLTGTGAEKFNTFLDHMTDSAGATQAAFDIMNEGLGKVRDRMNAAKDVFMTDLGGIFTPLVDGVLRATTEVYDELDNLVQAIGPILSPILGVIGVIISGVIDILTDFIDFFMDNVVNSPGYLALTNVLAGIYEYVKGIMTNIAQIVKDAFDLIGALINGDWRKAWSLSVLIVLEIAKYISDALSGVLNIFVGFLNGMIESANKVLGKFGLAIPEIAKVSLSTILGIDESIKKVRDTVNSYDSSVKKSKDSIELTGAAVKKFTVDSIAESDKLAAYMESWNKKYITDKLESIELERAAELKKAAEVKASIETIAQINDYYDGLYVDEVEERNRKIIEDDKKRVQAQKDAEDDLADFLDSWNRKYINDKTALVEMDRQAELEKAAAVKAGSEVIAQINDYYDQKYLESLEEKKKANRDAWDKMKEDIEEVMTSVFDLMNQFGDDTTSALTKFASEFFKFASSGFKDLSSGIAAAAALINLAFKGNQKEADEFKKRLADLSAELLTALQPILMLVINTLNQLLDIIGPIISIIGTLMTALQPFIDILTILVNTALAPVVFLLNGLAEMLEAVGEFLDPLIQMFRDAADAVDDFIDAISDIFGDIGDYLYDAFDDFIDFFSASGREYAPEGLHMVGEQGPELMYVPQGSRIFNNDETEKMITGGKGGGGNNFIFNSPKALTVYEARREFERSSRELAFKGTS